MLFALLTLAQTRPPPPDGAPSFVDGGMACDAKKLLCSATCGTDADCISKLGSGHICLKDCAQGSCLKGNR